MRTNEDDDDDDDGGDASLGAPSRPPARSFGSLGSARLARPFRRFSSASGDLQQRRRSHLRRATPFTALPCRTVPTVSALMASERDDRAESLSRVLRHVALAEHVIRG